MVPGKADQIASHLENLPGFQTAYEGLKFQDVLFGRVVVNCNDHSTPGKLWSKHYSGCVQGCFWRRLTFKSVD